MATQGRVADMAISTEGKLGLALGLLALGGGGAVWVAPDHTEIGWIMIGLAVAGAIALAVHHFHEMLAGSWRPSTKLRMIALIVMVVFGVAFAGSAAVYFWPSAALVPDSTAVAQLAELGWGVQPARERVPLTDGCFPTPRRFTLVALNASSRSLSLQK
jgi:hypothetical protein